MSESFRFHLALSSTFALPLTTKTDHGNFFADIYAVVELPDRSPASWIKKERL
jgi:hypothetical protein